MAKEQIIDEQKEKNDVLKALLDVKQEVKRDVFMKRFGVNFTIKAIDGEVIDRIENQATYQVRQGNKRIDKVDQQKFAALLIEKGCLNPSWKEKDLLNKYNTSDPTEVIKKRLLAGEISNLASEIMDISGYEEDFQVIEEVKN
ncbi:phage tail assembly chaperone [Chengkuizengella axinellae]|uniref:XkdN-like protein n=1 Tax=Chengkuizengella axinellae TaxID=3064388 RepID=A0ABT9IW04_9BACL|nr:hypothetical protein [Chengkuizengella sp. 2205SS18-9]MDP5273549.1 hypothetical protein [Chengkuizengella sp. 2205SS18-9]